MPLCFFQHRSDVIKVPLKLDAFQFNVIYAVGAIKVDAFSTDTKVFSLMWLEIKLVSCGPST